MLFRRRFWWFALFAVVAIALISQQVFIAIPSQAQNPQTITVTFDNPSIGGLRLDRCLTWEHDCGVPAAKEFCHQNGYSELVSSGIDNSPTITKVIGDGRVCQEKVNHPNCDAFKFITCSNNVSSNTAKKLFSENTKSVLQKVSSDLKTLTDGAKVARKICKVLVAIDPPAGASCGAFYLGFSTTTSLAGRAFKLLASDPPDPNYTVIQQPLFPSLPDLQVQPGLTKAAVDASNAVIKNQLQAIGFANAAYISYNRVSGAIDAGNATWRQKQLEVANQYMQEIANLLDAEPGLLTNLVNVLQSNGFRTITVSLDDVRNFQSSVASNGLPSDLIETLQQLGADRETIESIRQSVIEQDPYAIQGNYPQKLINQSLFDDLHEAARKLRNPA
ncbi:hypothetical protein G7B40_020065 [Aetokthonos hydrillicola Thurmond2011]|jgi:hypothetical protein|uniref:Uncharacterized protein n=1 Tax=Aetokthonos hydrillicola Thurmond2011 TaxID=2712845 RepID=A0AAP5I897_9CYAN|nr:hypothetical protein [Aetokthonos hydrillicola]MBO3460410.1 hypothetical protein [Aetokthonos hydrillicola CCALA 1050]MBW4588514.1 hypothetical protein [Aetokthonos hydrillicola CCALA 1050]MDR9896843.1 hypothetical protein [Aetokthonos hydrillicola Thurmond2011]